MPTLWYSDGPVSARLSPADVMTAAGFDAAAPVEITLGWTVERHSWLDDPSFRARTTLAGYALSRFVDDGRITALPISLREVPPLIAAAPPTVGVVPGVLRGGQLVHTGSLGWADAVARHAERLVVEVDPGGIDLGAPPIAGNVVAVVNRPPLSGSTPRPGRPADDIDLAIGATVAALLPDEPTLQFGLGGIAEGIALALNRPVHIWSGLVTDAIARLHDRRLLLGPVTAAYAWGGQPIADLFAVGMLDMQPVGVTHDLERLTAIPRFVSCNTAVQVALDGSVNLERVGGRTIAARGGHPDFCEGASLSPGGLSIVALRSTAADGSPTIVDDVEVVSTPAHHVNMVVTEHGVADLRGCDEAERRRRISAVATG
ncbi:MAG TPA: acetyl-CoA hydrolase/transferase C-terminal domain-containing protein [Ilumatobacter sp.]|nr:acetyl-CoA hydrolase/transferase C-terminal domain-containing protein [Ilumatobacter sp.]